MASMRRPPLSISESLIAPLQYLRTAETKTVTHASIRSRLWTLSSSAACWDPVRCGAANLDDGLQKGPDLQPASL
jgi:hypothetical protein